MAMPNTRAATSGRARVMAVPVMQIALAGREVPWAGNAGMTVSIGHYTLKPRNENVQYPTGNVQCRREDTSHVFPSTLDISCWILDIGHSHSPVEGFASRERNP